MTHKNPHYRTYVVRKDGETVIVGNSTECAARLGVSQATFYNYVKGAARAGIEIEVRETTGKYAREDGARPCDHCPRAERCYLTSCEAYRQWFADKWHGIQTAYRRKYRKARGR